MMEFELTHWHWWMLAIILLVLEIMLPGTFFLWIAVAASLVGLLLIVIPTLSLEWQLLVFSAISIISVILSRVFLSHSDTPLEEVELNQQRGSEYIGRIFTLQDPIVNGLGKIQTADSSWRIEGENCLAGEQVKVVGVNGTRLQVEIIKKKGNLQQK